MALKDKISVGMSLPHRSFDPIDMTAVERVAKAPDALGSATSGHGEHLDRAFCFDRSRSSPMPLAITRRIRLGVAVVVLPVA